MPTLSQANAYHAARLNEAWEDLETPVAEALLEDAEDYIRAMNIRSDLSEDEQRLFDGLVCRLAGLFMKNPPEARTAPTIKSEKKEGAGFKKEVEYVPGSSDPYPYITAAIRPLLVPSSTGGVSFGKMVRR